MITHHFVEISKGKLMRPNFTYFELPIISDLKKNFEVDQLNCILTLYEMKYSLLTAALHFQDLEY